MLKPPINVSSPTFENERCILDLSKGLLQLSGVKNKNNKQSLQKTKASEMKTIQEEVDDMEIQNCQDTDQDYYT
jgi:hypothetical protein